MPLLSRMTDHAYILAVSSVESSNIALIEKFVVWLEMPYDSSNSPEIPGWFKQVLEAQIITGGTQWTIPIKTFSKI